MSCPAAETLIWNHEHRSSFDYVTLFPTSTYLVVKGLRMILNEALTTTTTCVDQYWSKVCGMNF